jgi:hypothetical protein
MSAHCCDAYTAGEDHIAECSCGYRERNFESLAAAQQAADRHERDNNN